MSASIDRHYARQLQLYQAEQGAEQRREERVERRARQLVRDFPTNVNIYEILEDDFALAAVNRWLVESGQLQEWALRRAWVEVVQAEQVEGLLAGEDDEEAPF